MSASASAKQPGDLVRAKRRNQDITDGWKLVRFEPSSGKAVMEKAGKRLSADRADFDCLNFPGSDAVWELTARSGHDENLKRAGDRWAAGDLPGVRTALLAYARSLDPAFESCQTVGDLETKVRQEEDICRALLETLRLDAAQAEREYGAADASLGRDRKDGRLEHLRNIEDRRATQKHKCESLVPAWRQALAALQALDAALRTTKET